MLKIGKRVSQLKTNYMKKLTNSLIALIPVWLSLNHTTAKAQCSASIVHTVLAGGVVNFTCIATGTNAGSTYNWNFKDGTTLNGLTTNTCSHTYTAAAIYKPMVSVLNGACNAFDSVNVIASTVPCNINSIFSYTPGANGSVTFSDNSTGNHIMASWKFANNLNYQQVWSPNLTISHTYTANGTYTVELYTMGSYSVCNAQSTQTISITNVPPSTPCTLSAGFNATVGSNGNTTFASTSTGTTAGSNYVWSFGNASTASGINLNTTSTNYTANGTYVATLTVINNSMSCLSTYTQAIVISNIMPPVTCSLNASFTHTVGSGGVVNFSNTSAITNTATIYTWDFGDGFTGTGQFPSHTYVSAGSYMVMLKVINSPNCLDSVFQAINVTGIPCIANANFTVTPTATPQVWNAVPTFPWNVTSATWSWGDGTSSNSLYSSHSYTAAGNYSICLSVTVSCGATASFCLYPYISKSASSASQMVSISVVPPQPIPASITENINELKGVSVYPNPSNGKVSVDVSAIDANTADIQVLDVLGHILYSKTEVIVDGALHHELNIENSANGLYFLKVSAGSKTVSKKILINK
jgi:PKD repeat protein